MDRKRIIRIAGYLTLAVILAAAALYFKSGHEQGWPYLVLLIVSSWLQGIFWGVLLSLEKRLTWF